MRDWSADDEDALRALAARLRAERGRDPDVSELSASSGLSPDVVMAMLSGMEPGMLTRAILRTGGEPRSPDGVPGGGWWVGVTDGLAPGRPAGPATVLFRFVCERNGERVVLDARDPREGAALAACLVGETMGGLPRPPVLPTDAEGVGHPMPFRRADGTWAGRRGTDCILLDDPHRRFGASYLAWVEALAGRH